MKTITKILIIDDDPIASLLYSLILKQALGDKLDLQTFNFPEEGVNYVKNKLAFSESKSQTILFLDINMPVLMGWDVLDLINKMDENIKNQLKVFMLSSSIDPKDKKRAMDHILVNDFIEKPLTIEKIHALIKLD